MIVNISGYMVYNNSICVVLFNCGVQFIVEELHSEDNESRQKMFHHQNKDDHISVKDVWGTWYKSEGELLK